MFENMEVWFVTGAQLLYGGDAVVAVDAHSTEMVDGMNRSGLLPVKVVYKGTANSSKEVSDVMKAAENDARCIGVITWMHTFSPAKMWIHGMQELRKPLLHLHTQFNKEIPWETMDMDFMNLNQSAHGDREFGHICARMRVRRKVVTGYWKDEGTQKHIAVWQRVCVGWADAQDMRIIRLGDQMNNVAVTDGDKVEAEIRMGYHVDYMPFSSLMPYFDAIRDEDVDALVAEYFKLYAHDKKLEDKATEEYRTLWVMTQGMKGGCSFLEDYTLNFDGKKSSILQAHMLEVCPLIAEERPRLEVHFLGIGIRKSLTARLVFTSKPEKGVTATVVDMGNRFRLIVNDVECIKSKSLPKLPVASALWIPMPNFEIGATAWILAGGTHHSCFSYDITPEYWEDYAEIAGIEMVHIDKNTTIEGFKQSLRMGEVYYMLNKSLYL